MENINIYEADGTLWANVKVSADCYYRNALEGDESVELRWEAYDYAKIPVGSYVNIEGRVYRLTEPHEPTRRTESIYTFAPVFYSQTYHWKKAMACLYEYGTAVTYTDTDNTISATIPEPTSRELDWSFTGNLPDALFMLIQMIKNETGVVWNAHYAAEVADNLIEFTSQGSSIFDFISKIAELCGKEFYFDYTNATPVVNIGTLEIEAQGTHTSEGRVLLNVGEDVSNPSVSSDAEEYFTRFYFFGSTRNIVQPNSVTKSSVVNRRLPLCPTKVTTAGYDDMNYYPKGFIDLDRNPSSYTDREYIPDLPPYKVFAKSVFFDDIYPRSDLKIQTVQTRHIAVLDDAGAETGENMPIYYVKLVNKNGSAFNFNSGTYPNGDMLPTLVPSISFRSGYLQSLEYELIYHATDFTVNTTGTEGQGGRVTIQAPCFEIVFDTNSNPRLPNDNIKPQVDDECTLFNIHMPQEYIWNAQKELEQKAIDYINKPNVDKSTYDLNSNPIAFDSVLALGNLQVGSLVKMVYPNGETIKSRVISIERHLDIPCDCKITLGYSARQGTIQTLRQVIEDTLANVETVVKTGDKTKAQLLGLKNGYMAQKETFDAAFDADGQFDGTRIKPLTIETKALMVGSRSQQFALSGIDFSVAKYTSGEGILSWNCTNGKLSHFTIDETCILQWNMATGSQNLATHGTTTDSQYIYAVVAKEGFPASPTGGIKVNSNTGTFLVTTEQKKFDSDNTNYYFLVGTVSSEQTESGSNYKTRIVSLTYGTTTINGKQITTGVIRSSDTNHGVIIDLDNGTITGNIQFLSGGQAVDAEQYINNTVDAEVGQLDIANRNFLLDSDRVLTNGSLTDGNRNFFSMWFAYSTQNTDPNQVVILTSEIISQNGKFTKTFTISSSISAPYLLVKHNGSVRDFPLWFNNPNTIEAGTYTISFIVEGYNPSTANGLVVKKFKFEKGESATEWSVAPEDVKGAVDTANSAKNAVDNLEIGGRNLIKGTSKTNIYSYTLSAGSSFVDLYSKTINRVLGEKNYVLSLEVKGSAPFTMISHWYDPNTTTKAETSSGFVGTRSDGYCTNSVTTEWKRFWVKWQQSDSADTTKNLIPCRVYQPSSGTLTVYIRAVKFEVGTVPTDWSPAPEDTDYLRNALNEATAGSTEIIGGLLLTKMIIAGVNQNQCGMAGSEASSVAFWAGGSLNGAEAMSTPVVIKKDGTTRLGVLRLSSSGNITMPVGGKSRLNITGGSLPAPSIDNWTGDTWATASSVPSVTLIDTPQILTMQVVYGNSGKRGHNGMPVYGTGSGYFAIRKTSSGTGTLGEVTLQMKAGETYNQLQKFNLYGAINDSNWHYAALNFSSVLTPYNETESLSGIAVVLQISGSGTFECTFFSSTSGARSGNYGVHVWWASDITVPITTLANNGLMVLYNDNNYFRTAQVGSALRTTIKGETDIPGVLWAGKIAAGGGVDGNGPYYKNTAKYATALVAEYAATGKYTITHRLGNANFSISVMPYTSGATYYISSKGTTQIVIQFNKQTAFDLVIYGTN